MFSKGNNQFKMRKLLQIKKNTFFLIKIEALQ